MKLPLLLVFLIAILLSASCSLFADDNDPLELRFHLGKAAFLEENTPFDRTVFGASVRFFLFEGLAIEPEFTYLRGPGSDRDYLFVSKAAYKFIHRNKASAYFIGGAGLLHHREKFPDAPDSLFTENALILTGGIGADFGLTERVVFCPEFQFGFNPLYRFTAGIGYKF